MAVFNSYVSLPEGNIPLFQWFTFALWSAVPQCDPFFSSRAPWYTRPPTKPVATALPHSMLPQPAVMETKPGKEWMVFGKSLANGMENHILPYFTTGVQKMLVFCIQVSARLIFDDEIWRKPTQTLKESLGLPGCHCTGHPRRISW